MKDCKYSNNMKTIMTYAQGIASAKVKMMQKMRDQCLNAQMIANICGIDPVVVAMMLGDQCVVKDPKEVARYRENYIAGFAAGFVEGMNKAKEDVVCTMYDKNVDLDQICMLLNLHKESVTKILGVTEDV